jgi:hypothetical protein
MLVIASCGAAAGDDDDDDDNDQNGDDAGNDDDGGGPTTTASFDGKYFAGYYGDDWGAIDVVASSDGKLTGTAKMSDGGDFSGEGTLTDAGDATFSLAGETPVGENTVSYTGKFRIENGRAVGSGQWTSTSGYSGDWVAYRTSDDFSDLFDASIAELSSICSKGMQLCPDWNITSVDSCLGQANCQIAMCAAKSSQCVDFYNDWAEMWMDIDSSEDCDLQPSEEWVNQCPDIGVCSS